MNSMQVAETIKDQIGRQALFMLGAHQLVGDADLLQFGIKGCPKINKIVVRLEPSDTYTVQFWKVGRGAFVQVAEVDNVYADSLRATIEKHTGLYTHL
jgi:hypothetical protein